MFITDDAQSVFKTEHPSIVICVISQMHWSKMMRNRQFVTQLGCEHQSLQGCDSLAFPRSFPTLSYNLSLTLSCVHSVISCTFSLQHAQWATLFWEICESIFCFVSWLYKRVNTWSFSLHRPHPVKPLSSTESQQHPSSSSSSSSSSIAVSKDLKSISISDTPEKVKVGLWQVLSSWQLITPIMEHSHENGLWNTFFVRALWLHIVSRIIIIFFHFNLFHSN